MTESATRPRAVAINNESGWNQMGDSWVDVWHFDLSGAEQDIPYYASLLNPAEMARAERFRAPRARNTFLLTRGRLKCLLGQYLNMAPQKLSLTTNPHGKPRLDGTRENQGLVFSISHTLEFALLTFSRTTALGADIEGVRERDNLTGLAQYCLSGDEWQRWQAFPSEHHLSQFIRHWVVKEAFVKAVGRGLALGLRNVVIRPDFSGFERLPETEDPATEWQLHEWQHGNHRCALVFSGKPRAVRFRQ